MPVSSNDIYVHPKHGRKSSEGFFQCRFGELHVFLLGDFSFNSLLLLQTDTMNKETLIRENI